MRVARLCVLDVTVALFSRICPRCATVLPMFSDIRKSCSARASCCPLVTMLHLPRVPLRVCAAAASAGGGSLAPYCGRRTRGHRTQAQPPPPVERCRGGPHRQTMRRGIALPGDVEADCVDNGSADPRLPSGGDRLHRQYVLASTVSTFHRPWLPAWPHGTGGGELATIQLQYATTSAHMNWSRHEGVQNIAAKRRYEPARLPAALITSGHVSLFTFRFGCAQATAISSEPGPLGTTFRRQPQPCRELRKNEHRDQISPTTAHIKTHIRQARESSHTRPKQETLKEKWT